MSYNLFLDDQRDPNRFLNSVLTWEVVRNYNQFVQTITNKGLPAFVSFDHDLSEVDEAKESGFVEKTGYDCAKWLVTYCIKTKQRLPKWQIHSLNPVGRSNIKYFLLRYDEEAIEEYFNG